MSKRYIVVDEANHGCCNGWSVADSLESCEYNDCGFAYICECQEIEHANRIADALNKDNKK